MEQFGAMDSSPLLCLTEYQEPIEHQTQPFRTNFFHQKRAPNEAVSLVQSAFLNETESYLFLKGDLESHEKTEFAQSFSEKHRLKLGLFHRCKQDSLSTHD